MRIKIDPRVMRRLRKFLAPIRRRGVTKQFTLLSNNCWGGRLYDKFGMAYLTPTIGLSMNPHDFVKFCGNLRHYLSSDLFPIYDEQRKVNNEFGIYNAMLDDIKVEFRHYRDIEDAITKWTRRKTRLVPNVIVKLSYYSKDEPLDLQLIKDYCELPFKKILFTNDESVIEFVHDVRVCLLPISDMNDNEFIQSDKVLKLKEIKEIINK